MVRYTLLVMLLMAAMTGHATKYYVSTTGSNANAGSKSYPFASLSYAATKAQTPGDTIFILPGRYQDNSRCVLARGVHITGSGINSTFIYTTYDNGNTDRNDGYIRMYTSALTEDGLGQTLSHFTLYGCSQSDTLNLTSQRGIVVWHRENVEIHHIRVANFEYSGIVFWGVNTTDMDATPSYYQRGNSVHHCQLHNCANKYMVEELHQHLSNCLRVGGQDGFLCYENDMSQTGRAAGYNWDIMGGSWNKDFKIYNNHFTKYDTNGSQWNFFFELFRFVGGGEIHDNVFRGNATADIVGVAKGNSTYGVKIYNNVWDTYNSTKLSWPNPHGNPALDIESREVVEDVHIYDNDFKNLPSCLWVSMFVYTSEPLYTRNIYIHHNRFLNIGSASGGSGRGIWFYNNGSDTRIHTSNVQIYNNTIETDGIGGSGEDGTNFFGICYVAKGSADNIIIRNNIITGTVNAPGIHVRSGEDIYSSADRTITNLKIQNNILYGNGWNNQVTFDSEVITPSRVVADNIVANPLFVSSSNLHLQSGSPAIDAGYTGSPNDPDGTRADIGAYYYSQGAPPPDATAPMITAFALSSTCTSLSVPILYLSGTDNVGITHWLLSETSTTPTAGDGRWRTTRPGTFTFAGEGHRTLYVWAKDAAGNISPRASAVTFITLPTPPTGLKPGRHNGKILKHNGKLLKI